MAYIMGHVTRTIKHFFFLLPKESLILVEQVQLVDSDLDIVNPEIFARILFL